MEFSASLITCKTAYPRVEKKKRGHRQKRPLTWQSELPAGRNGGCGRFGVGGDLGKKRREVVGTTSLVGKRKNPLKGGSDGCPESRCNHLAKKSQKEAPWVRTIEG